MNRRRGFTLVEVLVTLVILGVSGAIATLGFRSLPGPGEGDSEVDRQLREAQRRAVLESRPIPLVVDSSAPRALLLLPDGRVLGDPSRDPLTGEPSAP